MSRATARKLRVRPDAVVTADDTAVEIAASGSGNISVATGARVEGGEVGIASDGSAVISVSGTVAGRTAMQLDGFEIFQVFVNEGGAVRGGEGSDGAAIDAFGQLDVAVTNRSTITAGGTAVGGSDATFVTNESLIESSFGLGARVGDGSELRNSGTIRGAQGASIRSGQVINEAGALIEGTDGAGLVLVSSGRSFRRTFLSNEGTIRGSIGIDGSGGASNENVTIVSAGLIEGTDGTAIVIDDASFVVVEVADVIGDVTIDADLSFLVLTTDTAGGARAGLFSFGEGMNDRIELPAFEVDDVASVVMSSAIADATELSFSNGAMIVFCGAESFLFASGPAITLDELFAFGGDEVPLPGAVLFALTGLGLGARLRRRG